MAPRTKKKAATPKANSEPQYAHLVGKEPTASTQLFADWLEEHTGVEPDLETLQLSRALVGTFQKSDVNQARLAEARAAREAAKAERASAPKRRRGKAATAEASDDGDAGEEAPPAKKRAAKKTAATPTTSRRRRRQPAATE